MRVYDIFLLVSILAEHLYTGRTDGNVSIFYKVFKIFYRIHNQRFFSLIRIVTVFGNYNTFLCKK